LIKLIIFDGDGVLFDLTETHYQALNEAILEVAGAEFIISEDEHRESFNGLPTATKLNMLSCKKNLPKDLHIYINGIKQEKTIRRIREDIKPNQDNRRLIENLIVDGYTVALYTNSIQSSMKEMLRAARLHDDLFFLTYSNECVDRPKPNPDGVLQIMSSAGVSPWETMCLEDSKAGRLCCLRAGAYLCPIDDCADLTEEKVYSYLDLYNSI
jgi:beta-phosphoglucomutase